MNMMNDDGLRARQAMALALRQEMGLPLGTIGTSPITFAAIEMPTVGLLEELGEKAISEQRDSVIGLWSPANTAEPDAFALIFRTAAGVDILKVDPVATGQDQPLIFVAPTGQRVFSVDEDGVLREGVSKSVRATKARRRQGRGRLRAAAAQIEPDSANWETAQLGLLPRDLERMGIIATT